MSVLLNWLDNSRVRTAFGNGVAFILCSTLSRVILATLFPPETARPAGEILRVFLVGFHVDVATAAVLTLPLGLRCFWGSKKPVPSALKSSFTLASSGLAWALLTFTLAAEGFFFDEFRSRYNTVAIDYLLFPHEVFTNIWESYPVAWVIAVCVASGIGISWVLARWSRRAKQSGRCAPAAVAWILAAFGLVWSVRIEETRFSTERTLNELASNSLVSVLTAALTRNLEYAQFYPTVPIEEAYARARKLVLGQDSTSAPSSRSLQRTVPGNPVNPKLNLILLLEESLGSEFWGALGRTNSLTPKMDQLISNEAILFDNIYADGNRTIRGYEGVFCSFPPLPGDSIVARDRSENIETIARVLKRDAYDTSFIYAGRGVFDGTRSFATRNGWDHFVELKDFKAPVFKTVWGVCNEDLYDRAIEEARARHLANKPFFITTMSVSNHKPFTYPKGRISEDPDECRRGNVVKYSDFALSRFFDMARKEAFWTNTLICVVADHGARVYGSQTIPIRSYEIPFLIVGNAVVKKPQRISRLGCQLDVAPTLLGFIGRPYESLFFGHDLMAEPEVPGRVLLHHNRSVGIFSEDRLVTMSLMNKIEHFEGDPKKGQMRPTSNPDDKARQLERDAVALFQVGDDLYMNRRYRIQPPAAIQSQSSPDQR